MNDLTYFSAGIAVTLAISFIAMGYLRRPLRSILIELCGSEMRASFWTAFTNISLVIVPLIFATFILPDRDCELRQFFRVIKQLRWALIGLTGTLIFLGMILNKFIVLESTKNIKKINNC